MRITARATCCRVCRWRWARASASPCSAGTAWARPRPSPRSSGSYDRGRGSVRLRDAEVAGRAPHQIARAGASLVPQGRRVFGDLTVLENLTLTAHARAGGWDLARVLALFPSLDRRRESFGDQLSGGEQQMLAIGRALMRNPDLLLLDEPSEGLAPKVVDEVGAALARLREAGLAILLVEQNLALATRVAQRVYVMNKGQIVFGAPPPSSRPRRGRGALPRRLAFPSFRLRRHSTASCTDRRRTYSICALTLRSSSAAHRCKASCSSGSIRSSTGFLSATAITCRACPC